MSPRIQKRGVRYMAGNPNAAKSSAIENARVGYQVAALLWTYEGSLLWAKFNAMLLANSVLLGSIGVALTASRPLPLIGLLISALGVVLCLAWWAMTSKGVAYHNYWVHSARELEERYLGDSVSTVSRGGFFSDGKPVVIRCQTKRSHHRMKGAVRRANLTRICNVIICIFVIIYLVAGAMSAKMQMSELSHRAGASIQKPKTGASLPPAVREAAPGPKVGTEQHKAQSSEASPPAKSEDAKAGQKPSSDTGGHPSSLPNAKPKQPGD